MAIDRIQNQTAFTQRPGIDAKSGNVNMERYIQLPRKHYRNHNDIPDSVNMIKPEPGQGHLLNGGFFSSIGRFFKNRIYDIKSVYKGYSGTANDHQLGRTNDVGLVLGGLGIASFLTTKRVATMPKHMEFVGLASFLGAMALWPKIGIFGPARFVHGFDVDKRYIDDQGRNKSVFQDPNYVPFDLYRGNKKSEDLSAIADYMGIAKDADNRDDMVKDQMVKIARQNNTLWMLTSGIAVPTLTALMCNGFERIYEPLVVRRKSDLHDEKLNAMYGTIIEGRVEPRESEFKKFINKHFKKHQESISEMFTKFTTLDSNAAYKILTEKQINDFVNSVARDTGSGISAALAKDITEILSAKNSAYVDNKYIENLAKNIEAKFQGHSLLKEGILTYDEIEALFLPSTKNNAAENNAAENKINKIINTSEIQKKLINAINNKIANSGNIPSTSTMSKETVIKRIQNMAAAQITGAEILPQSNKYIMTGEAADKIKSIANVIETYLNRFNKLRDINELKMGNIADSQNAFFWKKLEKAFTDIAMPNNVITSKALKPMVDNSELLERTAQANLEKLVKDDNQYQKAVKAIETIKREYLKAMLGTDDARVYIDYIHGGNTDSGVAWTRRIGGENRPLVDKFIELETKIAKDFALNLPHRDSFSNLLKTITGLPANFETINNIYDFARTIPYKETKANVDKIENFVTECDRLIHALDIYKRADDFIDKGKHAADDTPYKVTYKTQLFKEAKQNVISAAAHDFFSRFNARNNPKKFAEYMNLIYASNSYLDEHTVNAMNSSPLSANESENFIGKSLNKIKEGLNTLKEKLSKTPEPSANNSIETTKEWIRKIRALFGGGQKGAGYFESDWQYSEFIIAPGSNMGVYGDGLLNTPEARYKAQGKTPLELLNQGVKKSYNSNKWLRAFGGLFIGVLGVSVISQFFFGKKDATIPTEKERLARLKREEAKKAAVENTITKPEKEIEVEAANAN